MDLMSLHKERMDTALFLLNYYQDDGICETTLINHLLGDLANAPNRSRYYHLAESTIHDLEQLGVVEMFAKNGICTYRLTNS